MKRRLDSEKQFELEQLFSELRGEEYPDPDAEYDFIISSAGDHGKSACGAFAGALWLVDHATVFLQALRQHQTTKPVKPGEVLGASAAIMKALAEEIDLPEDDETLQVVSGILAGLGVAISTGMASPEWEDEQRKKIESFAEQASFAFSGTGNELLVLPWALEVERSPSLSPLEDRVRSLRRVIPDNVRSHPIGAGELNMWAYFLLLIGRWKAATAMAVVATEMKVTSAGLDTLGWAHFFEGNIDKSIEILSKAMKMHEAALGTPKWQREIWSEWAEAGYHKCYVLFRSGRCAEATGVLQRLTAYAPDSFWTDKAKTLEGLLPQSDVATERGSRAEESFAFDVALSFAGEDRSYAVQIAERLQARGVTVFYDDFQKAELWGKNLYSHLSDLYQNKARFCVMLLSKNYSAKPWPTLEREAAQARAFQTAREYILPVRIDGSTIAGVLPTVGYLDWHKEGPDGVVESLCRKLFTK